MGLLENRCFIGTVAVVGLVCIIVAVVVPIVVNNELQSQLDNELIISDEDSDGWDRYHDSRTEDGSPRDYEFFGYSIENPEEVVAGAKPIVTEKGPYRFKQQNVRVNYSWSDDKGEFEYIPWQFLEYDQDDQEPGLSWDDEILTLDLVFQSVMYNTNPGPYVAGLVAVYGNAVKDDYERLFTTRSVKDIMFGYGPDPNLEILNQILIALGLDPLESTDYPGIIQNMTEAEVIEQFLEEKHKVLTGVTGNKDRVGEFLEYEGSDQILYCPGGVVDPCPPNDKDIAWGSEQASEVRGTDGQQFKRFVEKDDVLNVFVGEFGRVVNLVRNTDESGDEVTNQRIPMYRFSTDMDQFKNDTENPDNSDFFAHDHPSGILNVNRQYEMDAWMSKPHFLDADPDLPGRLDSSMNAIPSEHQTYVDIEPNTGLTMNVQRSTQFNVHVLPTDALLETWFVDVEPVYMPIFWIKESAAIDEQRGSDFRENQLPDINLAKDVMDYTQYVAYPIGGVLLLAVPLLWVRRRRVMKKDEEREPLNGRRDSQLEQPV